jgi:hypothetical protein
VIVQRMINGKTERYVELLPSMGSRRRPAQAPSMWIPGWSSTGIAATQILTPGAGATVKGTTGVTLHRPAARCSWSATSAAISRMRYFDYAETDPEDPALTGLWKTARARITGYTVGDRRHRHHPGGLARSHRHGRQRLAALGDHALQSLAPGRRDHPHQCRGRHASRRRGDERAGAWCARSAMRSPASPTNRGCRPCGSRPARPTARRRRRRSGSTR